MIVDEKGIVLPCRGCGQRNRVRYEQLDRRQRCGSCRRELPQLENPLEIPLAEVLPRLLSLSTLPVAVDFWAGWCGPCQMMAPELKHVARAMAGRVLVAKVNTDDLPDLASLHRISSLPTLSLHWQGRELGRIMGLVPLRPSSNGWSADWPDWPPADREGMAESKPNRQHGHDSSERRKGSYHSSTGHGTRAASAFHRRSG